MGSCCLIPSLTGAAWGCVTPDLTWAALKLGTHGCFPLSLMFLTLACSGSLGVRITGLLGRVGVCQITNWLHIWFDNCRIWYK